MRSLLFSVMFCSALVHWGRAERFLTIHQAQKILFPAAESFQEKVVSLSPADVSAIARATASRVTSARAKYYVAKKGSDILGVVFFDQALGKHEMIDYAVAISPKGDVKGVEILEYRESHGMEIRNQKWRSQFTGKNSRSKLRLHGDIYNISGATISCRAITNGIKRLLSIYEAHVADELRAADSVQK